ncbi:MAG: hypothetical protein RMK32_09925 [Anaerolineae bacterium]|nr:hypothetical protein [Thermoflexus sp.]MDW8065929.1 hypothetical protein [Anaerolineae bacterium]
MMVRNTQALQLMAIQGNKAEIVGLQALEHAICGLPVIPSLFYE